MSDKKISRCESSTSFDNGEGNKSSTMSTFR